MKTDSPSPAEALGQVTKVLGLLRITADELQVIIDHPAVRNAARQAWAQALITPQVRLVRNAFHAGEICPLTMLHRLAVEKDF